MSNCSNNKCVYCIKFVFALQINFAITVHEFYKRNKKKVALLMTEPSSTFERIQEREIKIFIRFDELELLFFPLLKNIECFIVSAILPSLNTTSTTLL